MKLKYLLTLIVIFLYSGVIYLGKWNLEVHTIKSLIAFSVLLIINNVLFVPMTIFHWFIDE